MGWLRGQNTGITVTLGGYGDSSLNPRYPASLRSSLRRPGVASRERRYAIEEGRRAEQAADRVAAAQRRDERRRRLADDQRGKVSPAALEDRRRRDDSVVTAGKMGANARPASVFRALHQLRSNRIERDRTRRRHPMRLVHGDRAGARRKQAPGAPQPRVDHADVAPAPLAERAPESLRRRRRQDQMTGLGVRPYDHAAAPRLAATLARQVERETVILSFVAEDRLHPPIAALRHAMRRIRDDETGDAGHERGSWRIVTKTSGPNWRFTTATVIDRNPIRA